MLARLGALSSDNVKTLRITECFSDRLKFYTRDEFGLLWGLEELNGTGHD